MWLMNNMLLQGPKDIYVWLLPHKSLKIIGCALDKIKSNVDFKFKNFRNSIWATENWDIFSYDLHVCVKLGMPGLRLAK